VSIDLEPRAVIEYELSERGDGWRYDIINCPQDYHGFRASKGAAIEAARADMHIARLFF
jgi:hypothetical protein